MYIYFTAVFDRSWAYTPHAPPMMSRFYGTWCLYCTFGQSGVSKISWLVQGSTRLYSLSLSLSDKTEYVEKEKMT